MSALLSDEEVAKLTGYTRPADQVRWLTRNKVRFYRQRVDGRPVVPRDALVDKPAREVEGPRWEALRERKKAA